MGHRLLARPFLSVLVLLASTACSDDPGPPPTGATSQPAESSPTPARDPVMVGEPIDVATLTGRILLSCDEGVFVANADGTGLAELTTRPGPEFDAAWSPDGTRVVYRDSRRGINQNDEIFVVNADGTGARNVSRDPGNDWGPDWSPDGSTIVFNSDREGGPMGGYLVDPDGSNVRRIVTDAYVEYPAWSPDGTRIAFMGQDRLTQDYDLYVVNVDGTGLVRLTETPGVGWLARVVTRRDPDRVLVGARRLRVLRRRRLPDHRRHRPAPRHLDGEPRRQRPPPGNPRVRPVRHMVPRRAVPHDRRLRPLRDPPRRNGQSHRARRGLPRRRPVPRLDRLTLTGRAAQRPARGKAIGRGRRMRRAQRGLPTLRPAPTNQTRRLGVGVTDGPLLPRGPHAVPGVLPGCPRDRVRGAPRRLRRLHGDLSSGGAHRSDGREHRRQDWSRSLRYLGREGSGACRAGPHATIPAARSGATGDRGWPSQDPCPS
jgi:WD40-like Beta Propeller Repeat